MSRMVARTRQKESSMRVQLSELIVMVAVAIALIAGVRYYFFVYKVSPGYALGEYLGAVKAGNVARQYELIDESDKKRFYPSQQEYEKGAKQSRGYIARIAGVTMSPEVIDPKKPDIATIDVSLTVRKSAEGQEIYQQSSDTVSDQYKLRKNDKGEWKVWLEKSKRALLTITPSRPGDPIGNG